MMAAVNSTAKLELEFPPSCVIVVPTHPGYFLIGTYYLHPEENKSKESQEEGITEPQEVDKAEQKRSGSLLLVKHQIFSGSIPGVLVTSAPASPTIPQPPRAELKEELTVESRVPTDFAILDINFFSHSRRFCTANSTGSIAVFEIVPRHDHEPEIKHLRTFQLWDSTILVLSISLWEDRSLVGATLSNGEVAVCKFTSDFTLVSDPRVVASHSNLEAWTIVFGCTDTLSVFSGGDDAVIQNISLPEGDSPNTFDETVATTLWTNRKIHGAGVTAILPLAADLLLTGSYDDHVRLLDVSNRPRVLVEANLGGGVWRLTPLNQDPSRVKEGFSSGMQGQDKYIDVLACCMHAGTRIIRVETGEGASITVLAKFEENQSMNYGAAVRRCPDIGDSSSYHVVSVSFYDKMAFLWKASLPPTPI